MPAQLVLDTQVTFVTDPMTPTANAYFTASFQEINVGDEATGDYQHTYSMQDMSAGNFDFTIDCSSLEPGESALRTASECWVPSAGSYNMNVTLHGWLGKVTVEADPNAVATDGGESEGGEGEGQEQNEWEYSPDYHEEAPDTSGESEGGGYESEESQER